MSNSIKSSSRRVQFATTLFCLFFAACNRNPKEGMEYVASSDASYLEYQSTDSAVNKGRLFAYAILAGDEAVLRREFPDYKITSQDHNMKMEKPRADFVAEQRNAGVQFYELISTDLEDIKLTFELVSLERNDPLVVITFVINSIAHTKIIIDKAAPLFFSIVLKKQIVSASERDNEYRDFWLPIDYDYSLTFAEYEKYIKANKDKINIARELENEKFFKDIDSSSEALKKEFDQEQEKINQELEKIFKWAFKTLGEQKANLIKKYRNASD